MTWHDRQPPFDTEEEAREYIKSKDNGWYDDHAVKFLDYSKVKPTKRAEALNERLARISQDEVEYTKAHSIHSFKARHVGCPTCESKLNREFLAGERCPLCRTDLRAKTTIEKLDWYKAKKKELCALIEEEQKKQKDKAAVKWLIKYEYHS